MNTEITLAVLIGLLMPVSTTAAHAGPQVYVELIVKACPSSQPDMQANKPDAVHGYYTEPINQGVSYDEMRSPTKERESAFTTKHCIDVPVPSEVIMGAPLTRQACMGHTGYLIAMQYLQQNVAYAKDFPDVGAWACIEHPYPVHGVAGM